LGECPPDHLYPDCTKLDFIVWLDTIDDIPDGFALKKKYENEQILPEIHGIGHPDKKIALLRDAENIERAFASALCNFPEKYKKFEDLFRFGAPDGWFYLFK